MTRKLVAAVFVQARTYDGRKQTMRPSYLSQAEDIGAWLDREIENYKRFKEEVKVYPYHRRRLAYAIRVYEKEEINE